MISLDLPTGEHSGNTVTYWLRALHMADVFGLPYRIFVCVLGLIITMLSVTGVYIWWKKRKARLHRRAASRKERRHRFVSRRSSRKWCGDTSSSSIAGPAWR